MYTPASSAFSPSQRPSRATLVTWLWWLRNGGGVGLSGSQRFRGMKYTVSFDAGPYVGQSGSSMSGNSFFIADGSIIAPDSRCEPVVLPFSISATGTSPSCSVSFSSVSRSCISRIAQASPAGPPPTIATPTSMRSSSGSVGGPTYSFDGSTGGGNAIGATAIFWLSLLGLNGVGQLGQDLVQVAHDAEVGELEDRRVLVLVDRDDVLGRLHAHLVLDRAGDARREVQLRRDGLARLADLSRVRVPAGVDHGARGGPRPAERLGERLAEVEALGLAEPATAG